MAPRSHHPKATSITHGSPDRLASLERRGSMFEHVHTGDPRELRSLRGEIRAFLAEKLARGAFKPVPRTDDDLRAVLDNADLVP
jgi:hypothetical protein